MSTKINEGVKSPKEADASVVNEKGVKSPKEPRDDADKNKK